MNHGNLYVDDWRFLILIVGHIAGFGFLPLLFILLVILMATCVVIHLAMLSFGIIVGRAILGIPRTTVFIFWQKLIFI